MLKRIHADNVLQAANFLLNAYPDAVNEQHRQRSFYAHRALSDALDRYQLHQQKQYRILFTPAAIRLLEKKSFAALKEIIIKFARLLTPAAQEQLLVYWENPEQLVPELSFADCNQE